MLKRTLFAAAAAMVMCSSAVAQDGTYHDNVNKNMQNQNNQGMQDKNMNGQGMGTNNSYSMRTYDDVNNWTDHSTWMKDVWMSMNARDAAALQQALWRLPSAEEKAVRKALQKCHMGNDAMFTKIREHSAMSTQGSSGMNTSKFMMSDKDVWNSSIDGLTIYEQRQLEWVWENMLASERDALMNALRACHEHHWSGMRSSGTMSRGGY
jgi:hypothetical protein